MTSDRKVPWRTAAFAALLVLATFWIYAPALRGGLLWDDAEAIATNRQLRDAAGLGRIWFHPPGPDYFPLTSTVQWLEWHAWRLDTFGYHWVNVALHALGALLFVALLRRLARAAGGGREDAVWPWLGGLLFALHPLAVESVAWISELKNTLSLPLALLSCLAYLDYDEGGKRRDWALSLFWFVAALLGKTSMALLPAVLLLYAWWRRGRIGWRDILASAPFFAASLALGIVTVEFQRRYAIGPIRTDLGGAGERTAVAGLALVFYLWKMAWPAGLLTIYPRWEVHPREPALWLPWLGLALLAAALWRKREGKGRHGLLALGWFLLGLLPVLGFVPMSYLRISRVADHLAYLSLLGVCGLAAAGAGAVETRWANLRRAWRWLAALAAAGVLAILAAQSHRSTGFFRDEGAFWSHALEGNPGAWVADNNLGEFLFHRGQTAEAMNDFENALRLHPDYPAAWNNLGTALEREGKPAQAISAYRRALRITPDYPEAHYNLGRAWTDLNRLEQAEREYREAARLRPDYAHARNNWGVVLFRLGRLPEAMAEYREAIRLDPDYAGTYCNLGDALAASGQVAASLPLYEEALRRDPNSPDEHSRLGAALTRLGRLDAATEQYRAALRLRPHDPLAGSHLALLFLQEGDAAYQAGRPVAAEADYRQAVQLDPDNAQARNSLGNICFILGRLPEAIEQYRAILRANPTAAGVHSNLGLVLTRMGRWPEAAEEYEAALRLQPDLEAAREGLASMRKQMGEKP